MEHLNNYNTFIQNIITQSSLRRREREVITKFCVFYLFFFIDIMKINMKKEFGFLIIYSPLRPLRLCVK